MRRRKILARSTLRRRIAALRRRGERIVFTNGCFDIIHAGHVSYLRAARKLGDVLVIGVNTDRSVRLLDKGPGRPINGEQDRAEVLAALEMVDYVVLFDQATPLELIEQIAPDVLVKGGDWKREDVAGAEAVEAGGGEVVILPYLKGYSTTAIAARMNLPLPDGRGLR